MRRPFPPSRRPASPRPLPRGARLALGPALLLACLGACDSALGIDDLKEAPDRDATDAGSAGTGGAGGGGPSVDDEEGRAGAPGTGGSQATPPSDEQGGANGTALTMDGSDDWFAFTGTRDLLGGILCNPIEARASVQATAPLRVCYYPKPGGEVACPVGTEFGDDPVPAGYGGRCGSNATAVTFGGDDAEVLVKVSYDAGGGACFAYTLTYQY